MTVAARRRPSRNRVHGLGVRYRHSRHCVAPTDPCGCGGSYEAFVYLARSQRKKRRSFPTKGDAVLWRRRELRKLYGSEAEPRAGRTDAAYSLLRRTQNELDGAINAAERYQRAPLREVLDTLCHAEDQLLRLLVTE